MSDLSTASTLRSFVNRHVSEHSQRWEEFDAEWRSPCETGEPRTVDGDLWVPWSPVARQHARDFDGLANAIEAPVHPSICDYYAQYWSGNLEATSEEGELSLILLWNPDDIDRLVENLVGHVLVRLRARRAITLFFGCTDPATDLILSVRNDDGVVLAEDARGKVIREVADSLPEFLQRLETRPNPGPDFP